MDDPLARALVSVRVTSKAGAGASLFARKRKSDLGPGWSFDIEEPQLTGAEYFLGALAADALGAFRRVTTERRLVVDEVEVRAEVTLANPLALLGVIGAPGQPHYESILLQVYVGSAAPTAALQTAWNDAMGRAPMVITMRRATRLEITLQVTP